MIFYLEIKVYLFKTFICYEVLHETRNHHLDILALLEIGKLALNTVRI